VQTLRLAGESDDEFRSRAERVGRIGRVLVEACLANRCVQEFIADPAWPEWNRDSVRASPTVRVEYEQAIALGDLGSCLSATVMRSSGLCGADELCPAIPGTCGGVTPHNIGI